VLRHGVAGWLALGAFVVFAAVTVGPAAHRARQSIARLFPEEIAEAVPVD
jgi:hypothetical protein